MTKLQKPEYLIGGKTNIATALQAAREVIFNVDNGDRTDVQNMALLVTDGQVRDERGLYKHK